MRRVLGMSAACVALMVAGQVGLAQTLTSVPDNAVVMIKINHLDQTNKKVASLFQAWGIAAQQPMLADPLATLKGMTNVDKGVNESGEAAIVVFNRQGPGEGEPVIFLLPITDYKTFLTNFEGSTADGEITNITMPMNQQPGYVANWGSFAAITTDRSLVATKPTASKFTGLTSKEMAGRDIVAYVNFASFRKQATMGMGFGQMMLTSQIDQKAAQNPDKAKFAPVAKVAVAQLFKGLGHLVNETQAMTIGINLSDDGVQLTYVSEFLPTSYLGGLVQQWKPGSTQLLSGLPAGSYALLGGASMDGKVLGQLIDDAAGPILTEAKTLGPDTQPVIDYVDSLKLVLQAATVQSFGMSANDGKAGETPLFNAVTVVQGDAPQIQAANKKIVASQDKFQQMLEMPGQPKTLSTLVENAKTVDGVKLTQFTVAIDAAAAQGPEQKLMDAIYGKGGLSMYMGQVNAKTLISTTYRADSEISSVIAAAKALQPVDLGASAKQVAAKLPANNSMVMYLYGDQVLKMASKVSVLMTGNAVQTQLPANQMPVAIGLSTEGSAVRGDVFVPSTLIQAATKAAMEQAVKEEKAKEKGGAL